MSSDDDIILHGLKIEMLEKIPIVEITQDEFISRRIPNNYFEYNLYLKELLVYLTLK